MVYLRVGYIPGLYPRVYLRVGYIPDYTLGCTSGWCIYRVIPKGVPQGGVYRDIPKGVPQGGVTRV